MNSKKGFTLVELLAVIVILGIIITITATKGFGAFDNTKKAIIRENLNAIKKSANELAVQIESCDDDVDSEFWEEGSKSDLTRQDGDEIANKDCAGLKAKMSSSDCISVKVQYLITNNFLSDHKDFNNIKNEKVKICKKNKKIEINTDNIEKKLEEVIGKDNKTTTNKTTEKKNDQEDKTETRKITLNRDIDNNYTYEKHFAKYHNIIKYRHTDNFYKKYFENFNMGTMYTDLYDENKKNNMKFLEINNCPKDSFCNWKMITEKNIIKDIISKNGIYSDFYIKYKIRYNAFDKEKSYENVYNELKEKDWNELSNKIHMDSFDSEILLGTKDCYKSFKEFQKPIEKNSNTCVEKFFKQLYDDDEIDEMINDINNIYNVGVIQFIKNYTINQVNTNKISEDIAFDTLDVDFYQNQVEDMQIEKSNVTNLNGDKVELCTNFYMYKDNFELAFNNSMGFTSCDFKINIVEDYNTIAGIRHFNSNYILDKGYYETSIIQNDEYKDNKDERYEYYYTIGVGSDYSKNGVTENNFGCEASASNTAYCASHASYVFNTEGQEAADKWAKNNMSSDTTVDSNGNVNYKHSSGYSQTYPNQYQQDNYGPLH